MPAQKRTCLHYAREELRDNTKMLNAEESQRLPPPPVP
jgi:hypothetical protein